MPNKPKPLIFKGPDRWVRLRWCVTRRGAYGLYLERFATWSEALEYANELAVPAWQRRFR